MKPCCETNQVIVETPRPDTIVRKCTECGARHIEVTVDPGHLGIVLRG